MDVSMREPRPSICRDALQVSPERIAAMIDKDPDPEPIAVAEEWQDDSRILAEFVAVPK